MKITVICVGKIKEKYFVSAVDEYKKRLGKYSKFIVTLRGVGFRFEVE